MNKYLVRLTRSLILSGLLVGMTVSVLAAPTTATTSPPVNCPMMTAEHRTHMMHEMMASPEMKSMMMNMMKEMMASPEMKPMMMDLMKEMMQNPEMKDMMNTMMHEMMQKHEPKPQEDHSQHQ